MTLVKISLSLIQPVILQSDSRLDCCQTMIISLNAEPRSVVEHSQLDKFLTEQVWINVPVPLCNLLASIPVNYFGCRVVTIFQPFRNVSTYCITALLFIASFPKLHIAVSVKHKFHRSLGFVSPLKITSAVASSPTFHRPATSAPIAHQHFLSSGAFQPSTLTFLSSTNFTEVLDLLAHSRLPLTPGRTVLDTSIRTSRLKNGLPATKS